MGVQMLHYLCFPHWDAHAAAAAAAAATHHTMFVQQMMPLRRMSLVDKPC
jgi:hypothetical protein